MEIWVGILMTIGIGFATTALLGYVIVPMLQKLKFGQVILDIEGEERRQMTVPKLMTMYSGARGKELDNDRMLLSR